MLFTKTSLPVKSEKYMSTYDLYHEDETPLDWTLHAFNSKSWWHLCSLWLLVSEAGSHSAGHCGTITSIIQYIHQ